MKSNDWRHKNVARYTPGNTKILYFFNCLLDGMHTIIQVTQKKKAASIIALVCGSERYAKGLKETLQFISDQIMLFYTPESAKTRLGRHKPDLWIVTEDMTSQPNQPWRADRTTPVILITGNPDAVEIKKNSGKLTVLSMPLSIVDLRKTVEIYVS